MTQLLFIIGPTASGKSGFAVKCAKTLVSEVISCDSMQIYRNMNVGTAKVTIEEASGIKHNLIDVVNPDEEFSVAQYKDAATPIIEKLLSEGKTPVICGGTGLYVDALLYPLNFSDTSRNPEIREKLLREYDEKGAEYLHAQLSALDSDSAAKIHVNDKKRLIRALEINLTHGKREKNEVGKPVYSYLMIGFSPENRADLYEKINNRVDLMFNNGLIDEVKKLLEDGLTFSAQSMQAIGYKEFKEFFDGNIDEITLKNLIKQHTRNYAKRQLTWFGKYEDVRWFPSPCEDALQLVKDTFLVKK